MTSHSTFRELIAIDSRSLAALRISLATLVLIDLANRCGDVPAFCTDDGVMPRQVVAAMTDSGWYWSLHMLSGSATWHYLLFTIAAMFASAMLVGWHTRIATAGTWVLLASLHVRTMAVTNAGDALLRMLLFWCLFVPTGTAWSWDARRRGPGPQRIASVGTFALLMQPTLMYFCTGLFKFNSEWISGRALQYTLALDWYARPFAQSLSQFPGVLMALTYATLVLELVGPLLLWSPWQTQRLRWLMLASFVALHLGIEFCIATGLFSYIAMSSWWVFVPSGFWERRGSEDSRSEAATWDFGPGAWSSRLCGVLLAIVIVFNAATVIRPSGLPLAWLRAIGSLLMIEQQWDMFERPRKNEYWLAARALLEDGSLVDVLQSGQPYREEKPARLARTFPNQHWRYFLHRLSYTNYAPFRQPTAEYLARHWNATHTPEQQLVRLDLIYFEQRMGETALTSDYQSRVLGRVELE